MFHDTDQLTAAERTPRTSTSRRRRLAASAAAPTAALLFAVGCGSDGGPTGAGADSSAATSAVDETDPSSAPGGGEPVGVIAIGHSGLTAENADATRPGAPAPALSWATGTDPQVNSVYQRMIAADPRHKGHVANAAAGGASVTALAAQARRALEVEPNPALVIVQTIDGDIRCDGTDGENVADFGDALADALEVVTDAAPEAHLLLVGQLGRPRPEFITELVAAEPSLRAGMTGTGPCTFFTPDGEISEAGFESLTKIIEGYEAEQASVCAEIPRCATDGGVRAAYVDTLDNFSSDFNHLNPQGQAAAAALIWPVVTELLEMG